ncbi:MAG TPA: hypothetical protein VEW28_03390 [Candidatus Kapabacteria bacterium]|nr:hypothetical protein [Candidatus Kapabacteria bacterium]
MSLHIPIIELLGYSNRLYNRNLGGITHEDSVRELQGGGNKINWIAGHILVSRDSFRKALGIEKKVPERITEIYKRGSNDITAESAANLAEIIEICNASQNEIVEAVKSAKLEPDTERFDTLLFLCFHESYHVGQLGLARRALGFEGTIK